MNPYLIPLAQSVTTAVIEIIALLLGAALIGFFTAWYYQKSVYTPVIKKLEEEKAALLKKVDELNNEVSALKNEVSSLKTKMTDLEKTIQAKNSEIETLKRNQKQ